jgi:hypothetical protein
MHGLMGVNSCVRLLYLGDDDDCKPCSQPLPHAMLSRTARMSCHYNECISINIKSIYISLTSVTALLICTHLRRTTTAATLCPPKNKLEFRTFMTSGLFLVTVAVYDECCCAFFASCSQACMSPIRHVRWLPAQGGLIHAIDMPPLTSHASRPRYLLTISKTRCQSSKSQS